ncbi:MAG: hypothetical protein AAGC46_04970 [Solirubrobacteraceae bacterium]|nr:hypothetical protein [Patulibacter sp.]
MSRIVIEPGSLADAANDISHIADELYDMASDVSTAGHPTGISGHTTGLMATAVTRLTTLAGSLPNESKGLLHVALVMIEYGSAKANDAGMKVPLVTPYLPKPGKHHNKLWHVLHTVQYAGGEVLVAGKDLIVSAPTLLKVGAVVTNPILLGRAMYKHRNDIAYIVSHRGQVAKVIYEDNVGDLVHDYEHGKKDEAVGRGITRIALLLGTVGDIGAVAKAAKTAGEVSDVAKGAKEASTIGKIGRHVKDGSETAAAIADLRVPTAKVVDRVINGAIEQKIGNLADVRDTMKRGGVVPPGSPSTVKEASDQIAALHRLEDRIKAGIDAADSHGAHIAQDTSVKIHATTEGVKDEKNEERETEREQDYARHH